MVVPGDFEREHMTECDELGGIPYPPVLIESLVSLSNIKIIITIIIIDSVYDVYWNNDSIKCDYYYCGGRTKSLQFF